MQVLRRANQVALLVRLSLRLTLYHQSLAMLMTCPHVAGTRCLKGLGLRRMHQSVEVEDNPAVRGMISKISYMLAVD